MAIRSIIEVDVSDDAFQKFKSSFEKYQEAVRALPGQWNKVGTAAEGASDNFADAVAAMLAGNEQLLKINKQTTAFGQAVHGADGGLQKIVSHTHRIAGNIGETTKHLLKWTGIFSAIGGLLGAGSLWGLDRLARDAGTGRRGAQGLGLSFGEQRAFSTDIGRLVDPDQLLGGVNTAMTDVTQRWRLYGAGLGEKDIAGKDTAAVSVEVLQSLKRIADTTNPAMYGQILQARGLDQFASAQDLNRLRATSPTEFNQILQSYRRDRQGLGVPNDVLKKWQDLSVQLNRAGQQIESTFIRGLSPLAPQLEKLSSAFSDAVASLLQSPQVKQWIGELADGIKSFAAYLETPEFGKNVQTFIADVGTLASEAAAVAKWLAAHLPSDVKLGAAGGAAVGGLVAGPPGVIIGGALGAAAGGAAQNERDLNKSGLTFDPNSGQVLPLPKGNVPKGPAPIPDIGGAWGNIGKWWGATMPTWLGGQSSIKGAFLNSLAKGESGGDYNVLYGDKPGHGTLAKYATDAAGFPNWPGVMVNGSHTSAAGKYQFERGTWEAEAKKLGLHDFSPMSQDRAAWDLASTDYGRRTHRDLAADLKSGDRTDEIAAALKPTWTSANAAFARELRRELASIQPKDRATVADRGRAEKPQPVVIADNRRQLPAPQPRVIVENRTGGSAIISGAALAGPG